LNKILRFVIEVAEGLKEQKKEALSSETQCFAEGQVLTPATTPEELNILATSENLVSSTYVSQLYHKPK
jgi:hypothetical protein